MGPDRHKRTNDPVGMRNRVLDVAARAGYTDAPEAFASVVVAMFSGAMVIAKAEQDTAALRACTEQLKIMMQG